MPVDWQDHVGLVKKVADSMTHRRAVLAIEYEDYVQVGMICLLKCCELFDETRGTRFSTYAWPSIYNAMDRMADRECAVRNINPVSPKYRQKVDARGALRRAHSLDPQRDSEDDAFAVEPERTNFDHQSEARYYRALMQNLPTDEREAIERYLGLDGKPPETSPAIGRRLGLTGEAIRLRRFRGLLRLRDMARDN